MKESVLGNIDRDEKLKSREKKEKDEKEQARQIVFQKMKEKIYLTHHSQEELESLFELVKKGILTEKDLGQKVSIEDTQKKELEARLREISESYDDVKEKQKYLPTEFIITKSDILSALYNEVERKKVSAKVKKGLHYLAQNISPSSAFSLGGFFFGTLFGTSKNLTTLQEFYIDTLNILEQIDT